MQFVRRYKGFTGGHLKVLDYIGHVRASGLYEPVLYLTPDSIGDDTNPFLKAGVPMVQSPGPADAYFIGGMDWAIYDEAGIDLTTKRVVNFVQHVRHADPGDPRREYLSRPAHRICVALEVADAIRGAGAVGEIIVIENGIDLAMCARLRGRNLQGRAFIGGLKNPETARLVATHLRSESVDVDVAIDRMERSAYLERLAAASVAVLLPHPSEGFYLPALEAMAIGVALVTPDCVGNRGFCRDGETCLMPAYEANSFAKAALALLRDAALREKLAAAGLHRSEAYSIDRERGEVIALLRRLQL